MLNFQWNFMTTRIEPHKYQMGTSKSLLTQRKKSLGYLMVKKSVSKLSRTVYLGNLSLHNIQEPPQICKKLIKLCYQSSFKWQGSDDQWCHQSLLHLWIVALRGRFSKRIWWPEKKAWATPKIQAAWSCWHGILQPFHQTVWEIHRFYCRSKICRRPVRLAATRVPRNYVPYNKLYSIFVDAGVASRVVEPVAYDISGSLVEVGNQFQCRLPSNIIIDYNDFFLFSDETGINTNQMDDGHISGTKDVVPHGCLPWIQANTSDHQATVLPFTAAPGEPVICVIIFASERKHVESTWHAGIDTTVDPILNLHVLVDTRKPDNHRSRKYFPFGPVCHFWGKEIPALTFTSPSADMSRDILVQIFKALDGIGLFPWETSEAGAPLPEPCVVVHGHESQLRPDFLDYLNNKEQKWNFALQVHYLTKL